MGKNFLIAGCAILLLGGGIYLYGNKTKKATDGSSSPEDEQGSVGGGGGGGAPVAPDDSNKVPIDKPIFVEQPPKTQTPKTPSNGPAQAPSNLTSLLGLTNQQQGQSQMQSNSNTGNNSNTQQVNHSNSSVGITTNGPGVTSLNVPGKKKYNLQATTTLSGSGAHNNSFGVHSNSDGPWIEGSGQARDKIQWLNKMGSLSSLPAQVFEEKINKNNRVNFMRDKKSGS